MASEKDTPKIFCLYHQKTDCFCISPVTETRKLIERIKNQLSINEILNKAEPDETKKEARNRESILLENRLSDLEKI